MQQRSSIGSWALGGHHRQQSAFDESFEKAVLAATPVVKGSPTGVPRELMMERGHYRNIRGHRLPTVLSDLPSEGTVPPSKQISKPGSKPGSMRCPSPTVGTAQEAFDTEEFACYADLDERRGSSVESLSPGRPSSASPAPKDRMGNTGATVERSNRNLVRVASSRHGLRQIGGAALGNDPGGTGACVAGAGPSTLDSDHMHDINHAYIDRGPTPRMPVPH